MHSPSLSLCPVRGGGYRVLGKEVDVRDSGSQHHQLCGCCNLQLIQSHVAPHGPPARVLSPLFLPVKVSPATKPRGKKEHPKTTWSSFLFFKTVWSSVPTAAMPRFKSQCQFSSAAPFPTPPTISYTCQHPRILPALLGRHSKSGQVWPHGMEPIISKLSPRPCNQGQLPPSYILGGSHSQLPGSKHAHSCLTYL